MPFKVLKWVREGSKSRKKFFIIYEHPPRMICHKISKQAKLMLVRVVLKLDKIRGRTLLGKTGNLLFYKNC
jgi:hypothetical protein